jgi:hypothetical protein
MTDSPTPAPAEDSGVTIAVVVGAGVTITLDGTTEEVSDNDKATEDRATKDGASEEISTEDGDKDSIAELVIIDSYVVVTGVVIVSVEYLFPILVIVLTICAIYYRYLVTRTENQT